MLPDAEIVLKKVARILDSLKISYVVGGSLASSVYGVPRSTQDIDILAELDEQTCPALGNLLKEEFYADEERILDSVRHGASFSILHLPTMFRVDVFPSQAQGWQVEEMLRKRLQKIGTEPEAIYVPFSSAEDNILHKLQWYKMGNEVSDRQWSDVLGVLKVQAATLDKTYLHRWAGRLGLADLLARALKESALPDDP